MISLSIGVMHHPARPHLVARVGRALGTMTGPTHYEIVTDPFPDDPPSPWRTARLAWAQTPGWCTHRLVIQDDVIPAAGWQAALESAICARPGDGISAFFGQNAYQLGIIRYRQCDGLHELPNLAWLPTVALCLPRDLAVDLGQFHLPAHDRPSVADDEVVGEWARARGVTIWATRPSLFDHDDSQTSLMGTEPDRIRSAVEFASVPPVVA